MYILINSVTMRFLKLLHLTVIRLQHQKKTVSYLSAERAVRVNTDTPTEVS